MRKQEDSMGREIRVWLALGILALAGTATSAGAQVSPADMRSGCINFGAGVGLLETSLFSVPTGYSFVLTDFNFSPSGYPTAPVTATWAVSMWVRDWNLNN